MVNRGARVGAAAFVLGLSLSGPQAAGVAAAETPEPDPQVTAGPPAQRPADAPGRPSRAERRAAQRPQNSTAGAATTTTAPAPGAARRAQGRAAARPAAAARNRPAPVAGPVAAVPAGLGVEPVTAAPTTPGSGPAVRGRTGARTGGAAPAASMVMLQTGAASSEPAAVFAALPADWRAAPTGAMAVITVAVNNFFDSAAKWVSALPGGSISDFLQGALLLVRRTLFGFVPSVGAPTGGSQTVASPYFTDQQLRDYLLELAEQRYGSLFGQTVPYYGYYPYYRLDGPEAVAGGVTSDTNTQVNGVDEADFVETDGHYIYVANNGGLTILDSGSNVASQIVLASGTVVGQYLSGDRLTVITQSGGGWYGPYVKMAPGYFWDWNPQTTVTVYDVTDRSAPVLASQNVFDGSYADSRAVDGTVYVVLNRDLKLPAPEYVETPADEQAVGDLMVRPGYGPVSYRTYETWDAYVARVGGSITTTALPHAYAVDADGNQVDLGVIADAAHIVAPQAGTPQSLLTVVSLDSTTAAPGSTFAASVGTFVNSGSATLYMTPQSLYVASPQDSQSETGYSSNTRIDRFDIDGTAVGWQASGVVTGTLINQFAMDERDGYLRVATHTMSSQFAGSTWATVRDNGIYVLDTAGDTLDVVGSVTGLAPGEQLYAVRYVGDTGYLVTFLQTDPLFAVDLSDPAAPAVQGELVIPGFSNYLQSVGDGLLLGIGQEREAGTWSTRMHVSLFDVADGSDLSQIERQFLDEDSQWSWSSAQFDHHALLYSAEDGLLVVPVSGNGYDAATGTYRSEQILSVLRVGADGIETLGEIHTEQPVIRTVRIGDVLYAVSDTEVTAYSLGDLSVIGRTPLGAPRTPAPIYAL